MAHRFTYAIGSASNREASEDRAEVIERGEELLIVVADGAGGLRGGATASDAIVTAVRTCGSTDVRALSEVFRTTDAALATRMAGETTAVALTVTPDGITGVSSGDSEAWLVSAVGYDILTSGQTRRRLGSGKASPQPFHRAFHDGVLLVATDGLFKHADHDAIADCRRSATVDEIVERLVALPKLRSGSHPDDVVVVAVSLRLSSAHG